MILRNLRRMCPFGHPLGPQLPVYSLSCLTLSMKLRPSLCFLALASCRYPSLKMHPLPLASSPNPSHRAPWPLSTLYQTLVALLSEGSLPFSLLRLTLFALVSEGSLPFSLLRLALFALLSVVFLPLSPLRQRTPPPQQTIP